MAAEATPTQSVLPVRTGFLQRKCVCGGAAGVSGECEECRKKRLGLQRKAAHSTESEAVLPIVHDVLRSPGPSLDAQTRAFIEPRFGHDFSRKPAPPRSPANAPATLTVRPPGDIYEQEADRIAEQVMRMPEPQRQHARGESCPTSQKEQPDQERKRLQTQRLDAGSSAQMHVPPIVREVLSSPGQPLDPETQGFMEPRFGHDFSQVRVHTDSRAADSARAIQARAYTVGRDVVFADGQFSSATSDGRRLLAHELAHVIQQGQSGYATPGYAPPVIQRAPVDDDCATDPAIPLKPSKDELAASEELNIVRASIFERRPVELQSGSSGPAVTLVQRLLLNTVCTGVDRKALKGELAAERYGAATRQAVKRFQREHTDAIGRPLDADGQVGPLTLGAMDEIVGLAPLPPARDPEGKGECYGVAEHGPGEARILSVTEARTTPVPGFFPSEAVWELSNFDIAKSFVKTEHRLFLRNVVVKEINAKRADKYLVRLIGEASTTAEQSFNLPLSKARAHCVRQALLEARLDSESRLEPDIGYGETYARVRRVLGGAVTLDEVEDRSARKVSIVLAARVPPVSEECPPAVKTRASSQFTARVVCDSPMSVHVNIGDLSDPHQPTYREFIWMHLPGPAGCVFRAGPPPPITPVFEWVKTDVDFHLASSDPDQINAPSEFIGGATHQANGANSRLVGDMNPFRIGFDGLWQPELCAKTPSQTVGWLEPIGPVKCGVVPPPPHGHCEPQREEECTDAYKMSAARRFTGVLGGASTDISKYLPTVLQPFLPLGLAGVVVAFGTTDLKGPQLTRAFLYAGVSWSGSGAGLDKLKVAGAPEKDVGTPLQLSTGGLLFNSDFNELFNAELVIHGASNKIEVDAGDAGTFTFFSVLCNRGGTRTYHGAIHAISPVACPARLPDLGIGESSCEGKEKCPESVRLAGHHSFTVKVGRATLASLPALGRKWADQYGCAVTAAFVNIQSEDGPDNERIHREFILAARNDDCRFTVGQGRESLSLRLERQLTTDVPNNILAPSDFAGIAKLDQDGELTIWAATNLPVKLKLPGAFDPACTGQRGATGVVAPVSAVNCGETPEPRHDTTPDVTHIDKCNAFKAANSSDVGTQVTKLAAGEYDDFLGNLPPITPFVAAPHDTYDRWLRQPVGATIRNGVFVGWAKDSKGQEIKVVAFADFKVLAVNPDKSMMIQFLTDVCAFDQNGKVVLLSPELCTDIYARKGEVHPLFPIPSSPPKP
jgi:hypothetical protein